MSMRIRRLVDEVDEQHREAMRSIGDDLAAIHLDETDAALAASRRRFVRNLGAGAVAFGAVGISGVALAQGAAAAAAPSDGGGGDAGEAPELPTADVELVAFAQSLELAAVAAYELAIGTDLLEPTAVEMGRTFGRHHQEHADALGSLVPADAAATEANPAVVDAVVPQIQGASDRDALLQVLYGVEEGAAATYLLALGVLESHVAAGPAATILPIESQHAVVIGQMLDLPESDWMPAFGTTEGAFAPAG